MTNDDTPSSSPHEIHSPSYSHLPPRQGPSSTTFILTRTPYTRSDVPLGSLVPDKRYPHQDGLVKIDVREGEDYLVDIDKNFQGWVNLQSGGSFREAVGRIISATTGRVTDSSYYVKAELARLYALRQPKAIFKTLCEMADVREWLEEGYKDKQNSYLIVGYRTLLDATLFGPSKHTSEQEIVGERIYAICYRKVRYKFVKSAQRFFLESGNRWKFSITRLAGESLAGDEVVDVDIDVEDERRGIEIATFLTEDGEERFVFLPSDEEDGDDFEGDDVEEDDVEEDNLNYGGQASTNRKHG